GVLIFRSPCIQNSFVAVCQCLAVFTCVKVHIHDVVTIRILEIQRKVKCSILEVVNKSSPEVRATTANDHTVSISDRLVSVNVKVFDITRKHGKVVTVAGELSGFISFVRAPCSQTNQSPE